MHHPAVVAIVTYLHFAGIITLFASLVIEYVLFKPQLSIEKRVLIRKADAYYGLASVIILATGFMKAFMYGKGADYYFHNTFIWLKLILFTIIGLLSIYPTVVFFKWKKLNDSDLVLQEKQYKGIKRIILLELLLAFFIPLFATLMARGLGYFG